jgi:hypothetical protein
MFKEILSQLMLFLAGDATKYAPPSGTQERCPVRFARKSLAISG